jgi:hypothetical protein
MKVGLRRLVWIGLGLAALGGAIVSGCGDSSASGGAGGGATCKELGTDGCFDTAACYKAGPTRSFKTDVLPIFEQSCSLSASCHGNPNSPTTPSGYQIYLGEVNPETKPSDVAKILGLIVGVASPTATNLKIVDAGKPETSFLMMKMDGAIKCASATCTFKNCGVTMPQGSTPLPLATRNVVRDWIKQGAQNN